MVCVDMLMGSMVERGSRGTRKCASLRASSAVTALIVLDVLMCWRYLIFNAEYQDLLPEAVVVVVLHGSVPCLPPLRPLLLLLLLYQDRDDDAAFMSFAAVIRKARGCYYGSRTGAGRTEDNWAVIGQSITAVV